MQRELSEADGRKQILVFSTHARLHIFHSLSRMRLTLEKNSDSWYQDPNLVSCMLHNSTPSMVQIEFRQLNLQRADRS